MSLSHLKMGAKGHGEPETILAGLTLPLQSGLVSDLRAQLALPAAVEEQCHSKSCIYAATGI